MAVPYHEMAGSPKLSFSSTGDVTGERTLILTDWDNIDPFVLEHTRPDAQFPAPYPGKPFLMVDGIDVEPFVEDKMRPGPAVPPKYVHGPLVKIKYKIFTAFNLRTSIGADFITYPSAALEWVDALPGSPAGTSRSLGDDVQAGVRSVNKEHTLTWRRVKFPPWIAIMFCLGKVNAAIFLGAKQQCMLFNGVEATRDVTGLGSPLWTLEYKFSEKNNGDEADPKGWNHFLRNSATPPGFYRVQLRDSGAPIYRIAAFGRLLRQGDPEVDGDQDQLLGIEPEHPEN